MSDAHARKILLKTFWSTSGWRREPEVSPEELAAAKAAGYMFDLEWLGHDAVVERARSLAAELLPSEVGEAFAASLSSRRLELRSAMGSYAIASVLPTHDAQGEPYCAVCGTLVREEGRDANVLSFERVKWGGVRHSDPEYQAFDLARFRAEPEARATDEDWVLLRRILDVAQTLPPEAKPGELDKALGGVLPSNSAERRILLQVLAYAGILQPGDRASYAAGFVPVGLRELPPVHKIDWTFPIAWWRGDDAVNQAQVRRYFPAL